MFRQMCEIVPPGQTDGVLVQHVVVTEKDHELSLLRSIFAREPPVEPGVYVQLHVGGQLMMSDTQMEKTSNYEIVRQARGDVLIAGLGIGLILVPILANPEVTSVTVVEKYEGVIELVGSSLKELSGSEKLKIVHADILEWNPPKGQKWDVLYFDIWPNICEDNLDEMATLHRRFGRRKKPGGWMDSWQRSRLKRDRATARRHRGMWY